MKIEGSGSESGSINQTHGSEDPDSDPDPHQNVMFPEHCLEEFHWSQRGFFILLITVLGCRAENLGSANFTARPQ
jgi:hypothetical protein